MGKTRIDQTNPNTIKRMKKDGRGRGVGEDYKAWLQAQDVPSTGKTTRLRGWRTGDRMVTCFSQLELNHFYNVEWDPTVTDYQDQQNLDMAGTGGTLEVAAALGYRHPQKEGLPVPMTTDLLVRYADGSMQARAVKPASEVDLVGTTRPAHVKRVLEKLEIEQVYWRLRQVPWLLITEIDQVLAWNVRMVHSDYRLEELQPLTAEDVERAHAYLFPLVQKATTPLKDLADQCDAALGLPMGSSHALARHLIAQRRWPGDFSVRFELGGVLALKEVRE